MKKVLFVAAAASLMFTACKKDDKKDGGGSSSNSFKIGTKSYSATMVATVASTMMATSQASADMSSATVQVGFSGTTLPTKGGTYKITSSAMAADEISVTFAETKSGNVTAYSPSESVTKTATVTINGGKVQVTIPEIMVVETFNGKDSVTASATFQQN